MTNTQPLELAKATAVLVCAMSLAPIVSGSLVQAQTCHDPEKDCIKDTISGQQRTDLVADPTVIEQQRAEKVERLSRKFRQLAEQWRNESGSMSSINEMSMLNSYQNIIGMGADALPLILAELRAEGDDPDQWFWALLSITEANDLTPPQIIPEEQGNFMAMAQAWLRWGEAQGYAG